MATIIPISTNTTIATCIQIHVGDIVQAAYPGGDRAPVTHWNPAEILVHVGDQPAQGAWTVTMINQWLDAFEGWQDASLDQSHRSRWRWACPA